MAKALVITEKPSVARDIAAALGGFTAHEGYFESEDYVLSFAVGHLFELLEPEEIDPKYKRWLLDDLPILPEEFRFKPKSGQAERIRTLKKLIQRDDVDRIVNACDAGREGELIFREIVKHFGNRKPVHRLWLQSMTDDAIREGFAALRPGVDFEGLGAAAECRAYSDWLIGMNATRALTKRLKSRKERTAWSAGRVQTPTLALLVERELEVLAHVPRPYWRVTGTFEHDGQSYTGTWFDPAFQAGPDEEARDDRIFDEGRAQAIVRAVRGQTGTAEETRKPSRESAPPLFDLTSLQREANRRFSWSAKRTLGAAQRCYEQHKILTYPRTDSRCLPEDYRATVRRVLATFAGAARHDAPVAMGEYATAAAHLEREGLENEARSFDNSGVSDHFAIIPTGTLPTASLSGDDRRLFDLVVRRFLGAFYPAALWVRVERTTEVSGERFRTRARSLQEPGWRAVLGGEAGEDEGVLAPLRRGQDEARGVAVRTPLAEAVAEETKPPARITEARLLSLMENAGQQIEDEDLAAVLHEKGIGTPATRADIIENLIAKGYAVRLGKALRPTVKGIRLIDILRRVHIDRLASAALTGEIEKHLLDVEKGRRTAADYMDEIADYAREIVDRARDFEFDEVYPDQQPLGPCPRCGKPVYERSWFYRCAEEPGTPEDQVCPLRIWKDTSGRYIDRASASALIREGKTGVLDGFTARDGRTYRGRLELDRERWSVKVRSEGWAEGEQAHATPEYEVNTEPLGRCPREEDCKVIESSTYFVCERKLKEEQKGKDDSLPKSCGFQLPRTVCKREITREEALVYLRTGRTELLTDFTSRFGRPFSATLVLKESGRHGFEFPPRAPRGGKAAAAAGESAEPSRAGPARVRRPRRVKDRESAAKQVDTAVSLVAPAAPSVKRPRRNASAAKAAKARVRTPRSKAAKS
ncbi:MAG TPA: DNA topoisomerase [Myxococcota bacterium]|nr:DNA topoisomerase [Myxococcota bacterium]